MRATKPSIGRRAAETLVFERPLLYAEYCPAGRVRNWPLLSGLADQSHQAHQVGAGGGDHADLSPAAHRDISAAAAAGDFLPSGVVHWAHEYRSQAPPMCLRACSLPLRRATETLRTGRFTAARSVISQRAEGERRGCGDGGAGGAAARVEMYPECTHSFFVCLFRYLATHLWTECAVAFEPQSLAAPRTTRRPDCDPRLVCLGRGPLLGTETASICWMHTHGIITSTVWNEL